MEAFRPPGAHGVRQHPRHRSNTNAHEKEDNKGVEEIVKYLQTEKYTFHL